MAKQRVFFTSDQHFGHARVVQMNGRPFIDLHDMNHQMTHMWNSVVQPDDVVWHLGDFAYASKLHPEVYFHRLNGIKHLVVGNHDNADTLGLPWASVSQIAETIVDSQRLVLCHYPLLEWHQSRRGALHLFGHCHGNRLGMPGSLDVGVDNVGYVPLNLDGVRHHLARLDREREAAHVPNDDTPAGRRPR